MTEIKATHMRAFIMDLLKIQLGGYTIWNQVEVDLAIMCADLPEASTEEKKEQLIKGLQEIKTYLLKKEIDPEMIKFLDEESDRYHQTKQISLYEDQEDQLEKGIVDKYARLSYGTEGIMGIHLAYNYEQLKKLTNGVS